MKAVTLSIALALAVLLCGDVLAADATKDLSERFPIIDPMLKVGNEKELMAFADQLFAKEDFYNALTVYEFLLFRAQQRGALSPEVRLLRFRIGQCYEMGEKWDEAERAFDDYIGAYPKSDKAPEASFRIGQGYFRGAQYLRAINHFNETLKQFPESDYAVQSRYAMALSYARLGKWDLSKEELARLMNENKNHPLASRATSLSLLIDEGKSLPHKSPWLAGALSIVPGLGKLYTHHYGGAVIAALVNGGLGFVIYDSFKHDRYAVGAVFSSLAAATYSANIVGGYRSAIRYNTRQEDEFSEKIVREGYAPELGLTR